MEMNLNLEQMNYEDKSYDCGYGPVRFETYNYTFTSGHELCIYTERDAGGYHWAYSFHNHNNGKSGEASSLDLTTPEKALEHFKALAVKGGIRADLMDGFVF